MATKETPAPTLNLHQRIRAVMMDISYLNKSKSVGSGAYAYQAMSEEKVTSIVRVAMIKHGLTLIAVSQNHSATDYTRPGRNGEMVVISISRVDVTYKLTNVDNPGEFELVVSSGTGVDPQDKGVGKAMTYAYKYALLRTFAIPTGNDPDDIHNDELDATQAATPLPVAAHPQTLTAQTRAAIELLLSALPDDQQAKASTWLTKSQTEANGLLMLDKVRALAAPASV